MKSRSIGFEQANLLHPKLPTRCLRHKLDYTSQPKLEVAPGDARAARIITNSTRIVIKASNVRCLTMTSSTTNRMAQKYLGQDGS